MLSGSRQGARAAPSAHASLTHTRETMYRPEPCHQQRKATTGLSAWAAGTAPVDLATQAGVRQLPVSSGTSM